LWRPVHAPFLTAWCVSLFPAHLCLVFFFSSVYLKPCVSSVLGLSVFLGTHCSCLVSCCLTAPFLFVPACVSVKIPLCVSKFVYMSCIWVQLFYSRVTQLLIQLLSALQFKIHCSTELYTSLEAEYFTV